MKSKKQDISAKNLQMHRAIDLYGSGKSQKEIASIMGVSEQTIVNWKNQCRGSKLDWDRAQSEEQENTKTVQQWIEEKIKHFQRLIDDNLSDVEAVKPYVGLLNDFIGMKKKYEAAIDTFGETMRVMEAFGTFVKEHYPNMVAEMEEVMSAYLRSMGK